MTTDQIVEAIDQELKRLQTIRAILLPLLGFGSVPAVSSITPIRRIRKPHWAISPNASVVAEPASPKLVEPEPAITRNIGERRRDA